MFLIEVISLGAQASCLPWRRAWRRWYLQALWFVFLRIEPLERRHLS